VSNSIFSYIYPKFDPSSLLFVVLFISSGLSKRCFIGSSDRALFLFELIVKWLGWIQESSIVDFSVLSFSLSTLLNSANRVVQAVVVHKANTALVVTPVTATGPAVDELLRIISD